MSDEIGCLRLVEKNRFDQQYELDIAEPHAIDGHIWIAVADMLYRRSVRIQVILAEHDHERSAGL